MPGSCPSRKRALNSHSVTASSESKRWLATAPCVFPVSYTHLDVYKRQVYSVRYWSELQDAGNTATTRNKALSLSWAWTRRDVDSLLFPTRGYIVNVQTDGALKSVMSTQNFVRVYSRGVLFYPLSPHDQLIVRGELGRVLAGRREGIPSDFLFRTGGDLSLIHI